MATPIHPAIPIKQIAAMLLARDDFHLRLSVQAWLRAQPHFAATPPPETDDRRILAAAAAVVELLAQRAHQEPPAWTAAVGALPEPFFAVAWAERPGFTRDLCLSESPEPFKRRNIFAPPNFLEMA